MHLYPENAAYKLGFDQIQERLYALCLSKLGQSRVSALELSTDADVVESRLAQAQAFAEILENEENFPTEHYHDLSEPLELLNIANSAVSKEGLFNVMQVTRTVRDILNFFDKNRERYPELAMLADQVTYDKRLLKSLEQVLDEEGEVKSSVSKTLKDIRKQIDSKARELDRAFQQAFDHAQRQKWLSEDSNGECFQLTSKDLNRYPIYKMLLLWPPTIIDEESEEFRFIFTDGKISASPLCVPKEEKTFIMEKAHFFNFLKLCQEKIIT